MQSQQTIWMSWHGYDTIFKATMPDPGRLPIAAVRVHEFENEHLRSKSNGIVLHASNLDSRSWYRFSSSCRFSAMLSFLVHVISIKLLRAFSSILLIFNVHVDHNSDILTALLPQPCHVQELHCCSDLPGTIHAERLRVSLLVRALMHSVVR